MEPAGAARHRRNSREVAVSEAGAERINSSRQRLPPPQLSVIRYWLLAARAGAREFSVMRYRLLVPHLEFRIPHSDFRSSDFRPPTSGLNLLLCSKFSVSSSSTAALRPRSIVRSSNADSSSRHRERASGGCNATKFIAAP